MRTTEIRAQKMNCEVVTEGEVQKRRDVHDRQGSIHTFPIIAITCCFEDQEPCSRPSWRKENIGFFAPQFEEDRIASSG